jgi:hypothetical protein
LKPPILCTDRGRRPVGAHRMSWPQISTIFTWLAPPSA